MTDELVADWFPPFLAAANMRPSHPLRDVLYAEAERDVRESYRETAEATAESGSLNEAYDDIADDVIEILRGVAWWVTDHFQESGGMGSASLAASRDVRECAEAEHEDERPPHEIHAASLSAVQDQTNEQEQSDG
ncbi:hypothetical protein [Microbacterium sp.]|uniref:hypothetical protein n=1 Tax=Microbacterium sp. TaxID=51671 RepID=UPI0039E5D30E